MENCVKQLFIFRNFSFFVLDSFMLIHDTVFGKFFRSANFSLRVLTAS